MNKATKITTGFVIQAYERKGSKFKCIEQAFIAGDEVEWEDMEGTKIESQLDHDYCPFNMIQPSREMTSERNNETAYVIISGRYDDAEVHTISLDPEEATRIVEELRELTPEESYEIKKIILGKLDGGFLFEVTRYDYTEVTRYDYKSGIIHPGDPQAPGIKYRECLLRNEYDDIQLVNKIRAYSNKLILSVYVIASSKDEARDKAIKLFELYEKSEVLKEK